MLKHEKVHSYVIIDPIKPLNLVLGCDLLLGHLIAPLYLFHEPIVVVLHIALLKNNWGDFVLVGDLLLVFLAWVLLLTSVG